MIPVGTAGYLKENRKTRPNLGPKRKRDPNKKSPKQERLDGIKYVQVHKYKTRPEYVKYRLSDSPIKTDNLQKNCEGTQ